MNYKRLYDLFIGKPHKFLQETLMIKQLSKFGFVGILNTIVGYGAFFIFLTWFNYLVSLIISHIIGVTHSYVWNKYWTFKSDGTQIKEFVKFNSVYVIVFVVNAIFLIFLVDTLNFNPRIAQLFVLPIITIISFTGHKYWSFSGK
jgi:putative flippase GtrA